MSKIMFVEDDIAENIDHFLRLFENILSEQEKDKIQKAIESNFDIPVTFKEIVDANPVLEFFDSFTDAIKRINELDNEKLNQYDLFILDRDLTVINYSDSEIQKYCNNTFNADVFKGREGDFLFHRLMLRRYPVYEKVYFLTAHGKESFVSQTDVDEMAATGDLNPNHFFNKSEPEQHTELKKVIDNLKDLHLIIEHREIFSSLARIGMGDAYDKLLELLTITPEELSTVQLNARHIIDSLLIAMNHTPEKRFFHHRIEDSNDIAVRINALATKNKVVPMYIYSYCKLVNELVNKYVAHNHIAENESERPSKYAHEAIKYSLLDTISWFIKNFE